MMEQIWANVGPHIEQIKTAMLSNAFFTGGAGLSIILGLLAYLRRWPARIIHWARYAIVTEISVPNDTAAFWWVTQWLAENPYIRKTRRLTVRGQSESEHKVVPAPGWHLMWFKARPLIMFRERRNLESAAGNNSRAYEEEFHFTLFGRRGYADAFNKMIASYEVKEKSDMIRINTAGDGYWMGGKKRPKRAMETVILPEVLTADLIADVETFLSRKQWYRKLGIPYRRGYLLYGAPGNGKSSLIQALASHLGYDVSMLNLSSLSGNDFLELMRLLPKKSVLVLEDVDVLMGGSKPKATKDDDGDDEEAKPKVTMSDVLNGLDGMYAPDEAIIIMTTNFPEKLEKRLIRPGRVDRRIELKNPIRNEIARMYKRFFTESDRQDEFANVLGDGNLSMAQVQGILQRAWPDEDAAMVDAVRTLNNPEDFA